MRKKYLSFWWHSLEGERDSLKYFKRVIKGLDSRMLTIFLYFVTGSDMTLQITFTNLKGKAERPISHTCTCPLEVPFTYR